MTQPTATSLIANALQNAGLGKLLKGKKTYIVGMLMVIQGVYGLFTGEVATFDNPSPMSSADSIEMILGGLGFQTVRAGIAKANGQQQ